MALPPDYTDHYSCPNPYYPLLNTEEYMRKLLIEKPYVMRILYKIRGLFAIPWGMTDYTTNPAILDRLFRELLLPNKIPTSCFATPKGEIKISLPTPRKMTVRMNNKHLCFLLSVTIGRNIDLQSHYTFYDRKGYIYFILIRPFHQLLVPVMMHSALSRVTKCR